MINYNCKPYVFTVGIVSWLMMAIGVFDLSLFIYGAINGSKWNALVVVLYIVIGICIVFSYCGIISSNRFFHFTDEGIYLFDKHRRRYNYFHKWEEFPVVYVFYHYRSYRIIFTTKALNRNEQIDFVWKSHKLDPYINGYEGFLISTFEKDKKLDNILKKKYGIGYAD